MASKPKEKAYILHHRGRTDSGGCMVLGRYKVGARNEKEAVALVKVVVGKHAKIRVYYEDKNSFMSHGIVVKR
ncbi:MULTISPECIES: hypothetical protein [unclassified Psychrobacillus]|uniref:hypothetical protein n=1 Tax=unclassified Psychrobacillus TaxID=2636677 RepID=UPI0030FB0609